MKLDITDIIVGCCGMICSACESYLAKDCKGCREPETTSNNCQIMECCMGQGYYSCTECNEKACEKLGTSAQNVKRIREIGIEAYIKESKDQ